MSVFTGAVALASALAATTGTVVASKLSSGAARDAADQTTAAANHAADVTAQANRDALQFQREEAQRAAEQAEIDRRANYDQAASRMQRLGSIGQLLGVKGVNTTMPAYVPGAPAHYTDAPTAAPGPAPTALINGKVVPIPFGPSQTPAAAPMPSVGAALTDPYSAQPPAPAGPAGAPLDPRLIAALRARMAGNAGVVAPRPPSIGDAFRIGA